MASFSPRVNEKEIGEEPDGGGARGGRGEAGAARSRFGRKELGRREELAGAEEEAAGRVDGSRRARAGAEGASGAPPRGSQAGVDSDRRAAAATRPRSQFLLWRSTRGPHPGIS